MKALFATAIAAAVVAAVPSPARSITIGQSDTFQDLTTDGWFAGGLGLGQVPPVPPAVNASGGPAGTGDAFLTITGIGGAGAGSRIVAINAAQWAGNYLASGVAGIAVDLRNMGPTPLSVRLLLENPMMGPPTDEAVTSFAAVLPSGGDWTHWVFPISAASLASVIGSVDALLPNVTLLRIIHSVAADDADAVTGVLGVDNITALASVPEPASLLSMLPALLAMSAARRRAGASSRA